MVLPCSQGVDFGAMTGREALRPPGAAVADLLAPRVGRGMVGTQQLWCE